MRQDRPADLSAVEADWHGWIVDACGALDVDPALVDIDAVHDLSAAVARGVVRPMGPLAVFVWGLAVGRAGGVDADAPRRAILDVLGRR